MDTNKENMKHFLDDHGLIDLWDGICLNGYDNYKAFLKMDESDIDLLISDIGITQVGTRRNLVKAWKMVCQSEQEPSTPTPSLDPNNTPGSSEVCDFQVSACSASDMTHDYSSGDEVMITSEVKKVKKISKKYKCAKYGWIPDPRNPTSIFYNKNFPDFFFSFSVYLDQPAKFKQGFISERTRQWKVVQSLEHYSKRSSKLFERDLREEEVGQVNHGIGQVDEILKNINILSKTLSEFTNSLYTNNRVLKSGYSFHYEFNKEKANEISHLIEQLMSFKLKLQNLVKHAPAYAKTIAKQNKAKIDQDWKTKKRMEKRLIAKAKVLYCSLGGEDDAFGLQIDELAEPLTDIIVSEHDRNTLEHLFDNDVFRDSACDAVSRFLGHLDDASNLRNVSKKRKSVVLLDCSRAAERLKKFEAIQ